MDRSYSIKKQSEIDALFKNKKNTSNSYFTIYYSINSENIHFRFVLSIGKKYGNSVLRNKMKRRLREIIRKNMNFIISNVDFVIIIKPSSNILFFEEIEKNVSDLLKKIFTR
ncbi:MAG: ribonuclease P protein component [Acholeplasmatales bacterium]|jgi:ribonuclease P protein component|nr:ribonuclease P protein component [Acholeplasmatales bacterium]